MFFCFHDFHQCVIYIQTGAAFQCLFVPVYLLAFLGFHSETFVSLTVRMIKQWSRFPREGVKSPGLEILKAWCTAWSWPCFEQSPLSISVALSFCSSKYTMIVNSRPKGIQLCTLQWTQDRITLQMLKNFYVRLLVLMQEVLHLRVRKITNFLWVEEAIIFKRVWVTCTDLV